MALSQRKRMLIWGKTAPELSTKYYETVCTGAVLEDGTPIRLYPIPFRYMNDVDKFSKYQWISATIAKSDSDPRPETYRIDCETIETGAKIPPDNKEWFAREKAMFCNPDWIFDSVDSLLKEQSTTGRSLGVVAPKEILSINLKARPAEEQVSFEEKKDSLRRLLNLDRAQQRIFDEDMPSEMKDLDFIKNRIAVKWLCGAGKEHNTQILDWEVVELIRKFGESKALESVRKSLDLTTHAARFFLGNFRLHPTAFSIVGLWYPKRMSSGLFA